MNPPLDENLLRLRVAVLTRLAHRVGLQPDPVRIKELVTLHSDRTILEELSRPRTKRSFLWGWWKSLWGG